MISFFLLILKTEMSPALGSKLSNYLYLDYIYVDFLVHNHVEFNKLVLCKVARYILQSRPIIECHICKN